MASRKAQQPIQSTVWTDDQLEADRQHAIALFRRERLEEPLEEYLDQYDKVQDAIENLLETTVDLAQIERNALTILTEARLREGFRYLAGPPISEDDLQTLADVPSLAIGQLRKDPGSVTRIVETIRIGLDRRRFPWVLEGREPTSAEREAAIVASTALIATQRIATSRRTKSKLAQENHVREVLLTFGMKEIQLENKKIATLAQAPPAGSFCCQEVYLGSRKADLVIGLWDSRTMPIECKVSNSSVNSVKRLNNDAAVKATTWIDEFGTKQIVPVAVISGVYKLGNLKGAQERGLTLYWDHRLRDLTDWIAQTR